jgi:hypothetical protein
VQVVQSHPLSKFSSRIDTVLISSFFAFPPFNKKFGVEYQPGKFQVTAPWQSGLSNGARVGEILGLLINGVVAERYGYRFTMIGSLLAMIGFIFIPFFAQNIETVRFVVRADVPQWGVFQTLTTTYAAEGKIPSASRFLRHNCRTDPSSSCSSMSGRAPSVPHHVGQLLLGSRSAHRIRSAERISESLRPVGISHSVRLAMDVAHPSGRWDLLRSRLALVACPKEPT